MIQVRSAGNTQFDPEEGDSLSLLNAVYRDDTKQRGNTGKQRKTVNITKIW
jgi:hypothetical protein